MIHWHYQWHCSAWQGSPVCNFEDIMSHYWCTWFLVGHGAVELADDSSFITICICLPNCKIYGAITKTIIIICFSLRLFSLCAHTHSSRDSISRWPPEAMECCPMLTSRSTGSATWGRGLTSQAKRREEDKSVWRRRHELPPAPWLDCSDRSSGVPRSNTTPKYELVEDSHWRSWRYVCIGII